VEKYSNECMALTFEFLILHEMLSSLYSRMLFIMLSPHVMMILYVGMAMLIREEWHYIALHSIVNNMRMPHGRKTH
jgi:hypothetical protein